MKASTVTAESVLARHDRGIVEWAEWGRFAREVEKVYRGEFGVPEDLEDLDLEIVRPSQGLSILRRWLTMLSIRAEKRYESLSGDRTESARRAADKRERILRGFFDEHYAATETDVFHDAAFFAGYRGRGGFLTLYEPNADEQRLTVETPDPLLAYPVRGKRGIRWVTFVRFVPRMDLEDQFAGLTTRQRARMSIPDLYPPDDEGKPRFGPMDYARVTEYWDDECMAWLVDDHLVDAQDHDYGFVPYVEARLNSTPLNEQRWASMAVIGSVIEDIKMMASLHSKMATGVETTYYPILLYKSGGQLMRFDPHTPPGEFQEVDADFDPVILAPRVNQEALQQLEERFKENIGRGTLPDVAYIQDADAASGFAQQQLLGYLKDAIADARDAMQVAFGRVCGNVLRLMEKFADEQPDGAWEIYTDRGRMERVTAKDIDGSYRVRVRVLPDLPQDMLQKTTIAAQLRQVDPVTGMPLFDVETAWEISGLADNVEDLAAARDRREWEFLLANDEATRERYIAHLQAKNARRLERMEKDIEREVKRVEKRELRAAERGEGDAVVIPGDLMNPVSLRQLVALLEKGVLPAEAMKAVREGLPMGSPDAVMAAQPQSGPPQEANALLQALYGGNARVAPGGAAPDGLTGYENGIAPSVLPAAAQGALPRRSVDQARLSVENAEELRRRGAKPPPK